MTNYVGTSGDDKRSGGDAADSFNMVQGGADKIKGGGGNDVINMGASLDSGDVIDGGAAFDTLNIVGDYSHGVEIAAGAISNIEIINFSGRLDLDLTIGDLRFDRSIIDPQVNFWSINAISGHDVKIDASSVTSARLQFFCDAENDTMRGGDLSDHFTLRYGGNDAIYGGGGDDSIAQDPSTVRVGVIVADGGAGDDTISMIGASIGSVRGGDGYDVLTAISDADERLILTGNRLGGIEKVILEGGDFVFKDSAAGTDIEGGVFEIWGRDTRYDNPLRVDAGGERDVKLLITGSANSDWLRAGALDDVIDAGSGGEDTVLAGSGDDRIIVGYNTSLAQVDGGRGADTLVFLSSAAALLSAQVANVEVIELSTSESIGLSDSLLTAHGKLTLDGSGVYGSLIIDGSAELQDGFTIVGGTEAFNVFTGGAGADTLAGGGWDDTLRGGDGRDRIVGGGGADTLTGGQGADMFVFETARSSVLWEGDVITDLQATDVIDIRLIDADIDVAGDQRFRLVDAFDGRAGQVVLVYDAENDWTELQLDDDGDWAPDTVIILMGDHTGFTGLLL